MAIALTATAGLLGASKSLLIIGIIDRHHASVLQEPWTGATQSLGTSCGNTVLAVVMD